MSFPAIETGPHIGNTVFTNPLSVTITAPSVDEYVIIFVDFYTNTEPINVGASGVSDGSNTYTLAVNENTTVAGGDEAMSAIWYGKVVTPQTSITVSISASGTVGMTIVAAVLSGVDTTSPLNDITSGNGTGSTITLPAMNVTGDVLAFGFVQTFGSGSTIVPNPTFGYEEFQKDEPAAGAGTDYSVIKRTHAAGATQPSWNRGASADYNGIGVAFLGGISAPTIVQSASNISSNYRSLSRVFSHGRIR